MNLEELKTELAAIELPDTFEFNNGLVIVNVKLFVSSSFDILEFNQGNKLYYPYYERLFNFYKALC